MDRDATLREVEQRVLWLATSIVHHANRVRPNPDGLKVGGHQASSASLVSIMTELWFNHLRPEDRVSVKPHASPVLHAINYLLGELSAPQLETLRAVRRPAELPEPGEGPGHRRLLHRLRRHRRHRPDLGCPGPPLRAGRVPGASTPSSATPSWTRAPAGRRSSTRWCRTSARSVWIIDLNRQSLDRIVPNIGAVRLAGMFDAAGWQVLTVKYGRLLHELFERPGGDALRRRIDDMENPEYQRLLRCTPDQLRERVPGDGRQARRAGGRARRRHPVRRHPQPRRPRPRLAARGVRRHRRHPPDRDLRLHRQGLRPGHRGPPAEPLLAAHRRADGASWPSRSARRPNSRGPASRRPRPPRRCAATPPIACAASPSRRTPCPSCPPTSAAPRAGTPPPRPRSGAPCSTSPAPPPTPRSASSRWRRTSPRPRTSAAG